MTSRRGALSIVTRVIALGCAIAAALLAVYSGVLVYVAATFEQDSLPGPAVLYLVAVGVGLLAIVYRTCFGGGAGNHRHWVQWQ